MQFNVADPVSEATFIADWIGERSNAVMKLTIDANQRSGPGV